MNPTTEHTAEFDILPCNQDTVILSVGRALDFRTADAFKKASQEQLKAGVRHFILDFSETGILDSSGLGAIFSLYRQIRAQQGNVVFAAASRPVQTVVQLTRVHKIFRQFPTVAAARAAHKDKSLDV